MANVRNLRREASALLRAAKKAFRFLRDHPSGSDMERGALLKELKETIDRADPPSFDVDDASVLLTMTNPTADALLKAAADDPELVEALRDGLKCTKQRAYVRLDLNHVLLRRLHFVLQCKAPQPQASSFKRLAVEVERDGLKKNPMEILGRMGL